eukprot:328375_1
MSIKCMFHTILLCFYIIYGNGDNNKLQQLQSWCDGIYILHNIELRTSNIGMGLYAKEDIQSDTTVIQIPIECCLFKETVHQNQITKQNSDPLLYIEPLVYDNILKNDTLFAFGISMYLLQLKKSKSVTSHFFKPFLKTMSNQPPNIPLFWRKDLMKLIKYTSADSLLTTQIILLNEFLNNYNLRSILNPFINELLFMYSLIASRSYTVYSYNGLQYNDRNIFIPILDLLNHNPLLKNVIFHYNATENIIQINVIKHINKNEQLFMDYGTKSNSMLLAQYGFILKDNLYQFTDSDLYINVNDINYDQKRNLLASFPSYLTSNLRFGNYGLQLNSAKSFFIASLQPKHFNLFTISIIMNVKPIENKEVIVDELRRISIIVQDYVGDFDDIELENDLRFALCENGKRLENVLNKQYNIAKTIVCNEDNHNECATVEMIQIYLKEEIHRLRNANEMYCSQN